MTDNGWKSERQSTKKPRADTLTLKRRNDMVEQRIIFVERGLLE